MIELLHGKRIYIDTNIFIYAVEGYSEFVEPLTSLFSAIDNDELEAVTSELTLAESLVKPFKDDNKHLQSVYLAALHSGQSFSVVPIDRFILVEAARIRANSTFLNLADAIHLATADFFHCSCFLTNDKRLVSVHAKFEIVILSEVANGAKGISK